MNNIFLCGFMGCGKSTVGRELAKLLNMKFIDMDSFIEENEGRKIPEIFRENGESYFRTLETRAANDLSAMKNVVVGTGGGAVLNKANVDAMKAGGKIVFIDVPLEVIAARLKNDKSRPLLQKANKLEVMTELYNKRIPNYKAASDFAVINPDNRNARKIAFEIKNQLML